MKGKLNIKLFYGPQEENKTDKNNNSTSDIPNTKPKSNLEPQKNRHTINTFIEAVDNDIEKILENKQILPRSNISKDQKTIINGFSKRDDLVFTEADKVGATTTDTRTHKNDQGPN